jgi:hypothetical protein
MFTSDEIQKRVKQNPFVPMRIITSAGDHYDVHHPELVMVGRRLVIVGTASAKNPSQFDTATRLSILHIAAIENLSAETPTGSNGQPGA